MSPGKGESNAKDRGSGLMAGILLNLVASLGTGRFSTVTRQETGLGLRQ